MKRTIVSVLCLSLAVFILASCSSSLGTPPASTADVSGIQTKAAQDVLASLTANAPTITSTPSDILYFEDFSNPNDDWPISDDPGSARRYLRGQYLITAKENEYIHWGLAGEDISNGVLNVDVRMVSGDKEDAYAAVIWRDITKNSDDSYYMLGFNDDGCFQVDKSLQGTWVSLIQFSCSPAFNAPGNSNKVTIAYNNDVSEIFINEEYVGSITDTSLRSGDIGLGVALTNGSITPSEFSFDNLVVYKYDLTNGSIPKKSTVSPTKISTNGSSIPVPTIRPIINPTSTPKLPLEITLKVTNLCPEQHTVIFDGPTHLKYVVGSGDTKEWQGAKGTYRWTVDGITSEHSPQDLHVAVWTLTLCE